MQRNYRFIDIAIFSTLGCMVFITCVLGFIKYVAYDDFKYVTDERDIPHALDLSTY
jgi:hypothetical protein